jgi:hypothetical protein
MRHDWEGDIHTLTVHSVTLPEPGDLFSDGELDYDIGHPSSCEEVAEEWNGGVTVMQWTCDVAATAGDVGLPFSLRYSGTPVTQPGKYRIRCWGAKYYVPDYGCYEYDGGVVIDFSKPVDRGAYRRRQLARRRRRR